MATTKFAELNRTLHDNWLELSGQRDAAIAAGDELLMRQLQVKVDAVVSEFTELNLGLARSIAKKYCRSGASFNEDYMQAAVMGLLEAFRSWDPDQSQFSSWGQLIINKAVYREVAALEHPSAKDWLFSEFGKVKDAKSELIAEGIHPTLDAIAERAGVSVESVRIVFTEHLSMDSQMASDDGEGSSYGALFIARPLLDEDKLETEGRVEALELALEQLTPEDADIVRRYYGLDGNPPQSFRKMEAETGINREVARRREHKALKQLATLLANT